MVKKGFTLVEAMLSIAIAAVVTGTIILVLQSGLECWRYGQERLSVQKAASDIMDILTEGGYDSDGIRDAVEIERANARSFTFVGLWRDDSHKPDSVKNPEQRFTLNRQYKAGSSLPLGQIRKEGSYDWETVPIKFYYASGIDAKNPDDEVVYIDEIPPLADLRIIFKPNAKADPRVAKTFYWDPVYKKIFETYDEVTKNVLKYDTGTEVDYLHFTYFDGLNQPVLPPNPEADLPLKDLNRVTAVKIYLRVKKGPEYKEQTSYINIRSTIGGGIAVSEGSIIPMPNSEDVKAFYIGNFQGVRGPSTIELEVAPRIGKAWKVRLDIAPSGQELVLTNFSIDYPIGTTVFFDRPFSKFKSNDSINLLTIDRGGFYDYDDDEDIRDAVLVKGEDIVLTVKRLDVDGANLYVKP